MFGPVYYVAVANVFCMLSPLAILFIYVGKVGYPGSRMWKDGSFLPNTPVGIIVYLLKIIGTVLLMVGVMQTTHLHTKIMKRWRDIRSGNHVVEAKADPDVIKLSPPQAAPTG